VVRRVSPGPSLGRPHRILLQRMLDLDAATSGIEMYLVRDARAG
jgi:hypothetical protein